MSFFSTFHIQHILLHFLPAQLNSAQLLTCHIFCCSCQAHVLYQQMWRVRFQSWLHYSTFVIFIAVPAPYHLSWCPPAILNVPTIALVVSKTGKLGTTRIVVIEVPVHRVMYYLHRRCCVQRQYPSHVIQSQCNSSTQESLTIATRLVIFFFCDFIILVSVSFFLLALFSFLLYFIVVVVVVYYLSPVVVLYDNKIVRMCFAAIFRYCFVLFNFVHGLLSVQKSVHKRAGWFCDALTRWFACSFIGLWVNREFLSSQFTQNPVNEQPDDECGGVWCGKK